MTILLMNIVVVWFDTFVFALIFETNNAILSPKYNIFDNWEYCVGKILNVPRSVLWDISVRVIMHIRLVVAGARHSPSRCATVCDYHWVYPPGCVGNLTRGVQNNAPWSIYWCIHWPQKFNVWQLKLTTNCEMEKFLRGIWSKFSLQLDCQSVWHGGYVITFAAEVQF